jgi:nucleoside-diphosphate-sugar epimerase
MMNSGQKWKVMGLNYGALTLYCPIFQTDKKNKINFIGWKARIGLEEGISKTYKWYVENAK